MFPEVTAIEGLQLRGSSKHVEIHQIAVKLWQTMEQMHQMLAVNGSDSRRKPYFAIAENRTRNALCAAP